MGGQIWLMLSCWTEIPGDVRELGGGVCVWGGGGGGAGGVRQGRTLRYHHQNDFCIN